MSFSLGLLRKWGSHAMQRTRLATAASRRTCANPLRKLSTRSSSLDEPSTSGRSAVVAGDDPLPPHLAELVTVLDLHAKTTSLPPLRKMHHFVNLTNGIEAIETLEKLGLPYQFCRIQSTACEQQNFDIILGSLDPHLLTLLALNKPCLVWDFGCRNQLGLPRSFWYGLEFVRYSLARLWYKDSHVRAFTRGFDSTQTFEAYLRNGLSASLERKIRYYAKLRGGAPPPSPEPIPLYGAWRMTDNDPNFAFFVDRINSAPSIHGREGGRPGLRVDRSVPYQSESAEPRPEAQPDESVDEVQGPFEELRGEGFSLFVPGLSKARTKELKAQLSLGKLV